MKRSTMPDSLVNSLLKHKESGEIKRVIRDDGPNGLHVSPPDKPVMMRPISREEFTDQWEVYMTEAEQLSDREDAPEMEKPFRHEYAQSGAVRRSANLSSQLTMPTVDTRQGA